MIHLANINFMQDIKLVPSTTLSLFLHWMIPSFNFCSSARNFRTFSQPEHQTDSFKWFCLFMTIGQRELFLSVQREFLPYHDNIQSTFFFLWCDNLSSTKISSILLHLFQTYRFSSPPQKKNLCITCFMTHIQQLNHHSYTTIAPVQYLLVINAYKTNWRKPKIQNDDKFKTLRQQQQQQTYTETYTHTQIYVKTMSE